MNQKVHEKKHRLSAEYYAGEKVVAFTLCVLNKEQLFNNTEIFQIFERILLDQLIRYSCVALVYLFMPNHVHIILQGKNEKSNVLNAVRMFKQKTGYWLSQNKINAKWQKDFYDHILRDEKDFENQVYYVLNNPMRAGLVSYWKEYLFKGSSLYDLSEWE
jgi:putative transposase